MQYSSNNIMIGQLFNSHSCQLRVFTLGVNWNWMQDWFIPLIIWNASTLKPMITFPKGWLWIELLIHLFSHFGQNYKCCINVKNALQALSLMVVSLDEFTIFLFPYICSKVRCDYHWMYPSPMVLDLTNEFVKLKKIKPKLPFLYLFL